MGKFCKISAHSSKISLKYQMHLKPIMKVSSKVSVPCHRIFSGLHQFRFGRRLGARSEAVVDVRAVAVDLK